MGPFAVLVRLRVSNSFTSFPSLGKGLPNPPLHLPALFSQIIESLLSSKSAIIFILFGKKIKNKNYNSQSDLYVLIYSPYIFNKLAMFHSLCSINPQNPKCFKTQSVARPYPQFLSSDSLLMLKKQPLFSQAQTRKLRTRKSSSFPVVYAAQSNFFKG